MTELENLEAKRAELTARLLDIQTQLSLKNRTNAEGQRLGPREYHEWRDRCVWAARKTQQQIQEINAELKSLRRQAHEQAHAGVPMKMDDPRTLVVAAYRVLRTLASQGVDLDPPEQKVMDALQDFIHRGGALSAEDHAA